MLRVVVGGMQSYLETLIARRQGLLVTAQVHWRAQKCVFDPRKRVKARVSLMAELFHRWCWVVVLHLDS